MGDGTTHLIRIADWRLGRGIIIGGNQCRSYVPIKIITVTSGRDKNSHQTCSWCGRQLVWLIHLPTTGHAKLVSLTFDLVTSKLIRELHLTRTIFATILGCGKPKKLAPIFWTEQSLESLKFKNLKKAFRSWVRVEQRTGRIDTWVAIRNAAFWKKGRITAVSHGASQHLAPRYNYQYLLTYLLYWSLALTRVGTTWHSKIDWSHRSVLR